MPTPPPPRAVPAARDRAGGESSGEARSQLRRAFAILDAFDYRDREVRLTDLAARTGLPKPTVLRIARELVAWGALERTATGYRLGVRLFMLGERVPREGALRDVALPFLEDLYEATHENVNLGVLHGSDVLYLARVTGHRSSDVPMRIGDTMPAYCTSIGKILLACSPREVLEQVVADGLPRRTPHTVVMPGRLAAQLRTAAERGYAIQSEETHVGVVSVAAPVLSADGRPLAGISVTGRAGRLDPRRYAPAVVTAARALSRRLQTTAVPAGDLTSRTGSPAPR